MQMDRHRCFNLVIERLLISGTHARHANQPRLNVSISLSSGFSFQVIHAPFLLGSHVPVSISLSSGFSFQVTDVHRYQRLHRCFNLVIERLLISGDANQWVIMRIATAFQSRYRAASHFRDFSRLWKRRFPSFNLVIERLLISGIENRARNRRIVQVSISLSSGFSFQERAPIRKRMRASCFNLVIERLLISG